MQFEAEYSLKSDNSFGFDVKARFRARAESQEDIQEALVFASDRSLPLMVMGEGSNLVLAGDYPGLVLNIAIGGKKIVKEEGERVWLSVGAGENWHDLVLWCLDNGLYGIENLVLIPGTVGAAPIQNIGAYGVELESCFEQLQAVCRETGKVELFDSSACAFGYRDSIFKGALKDRYIISQVTLRLNRNPQLNTGYGEIESELSAMDVLADPHAVAEAVTRIRRRKLPDPNEIGNAGSFFKNPIIRQDEFEPLRQRFPDIVGYPDGDRVKVAAGWLVDQCGWKGTRQGDAGVHDRQALVLVNYGNATGEQVLELAKKIQNSVEQTFGIKLDLEPRVYP